MDEKQDLWGEIESAQTEELPSVMISGQPDPTAAPPQMYGGQQMILLQQPSSAPKVIGIFVIIYGALSAFGGLFGALGIGLLDDSVIISRGMVIFFSAISVLLGIGFIITGTQINQRKKIGVQLSWILICISLTLGLAQIALTPAVDMDGVSPSLFYGIQIGGQVVCNAICGLLVAIPLMVHNSMMDDSSLWG